MLIRLCFAASFLAIAACASTPSLRAGQSVKLTGVVGYSTCPTTELYKESFPSLSLSQPVMMQGIGRIELLDMPLSEYNLINYGAWVGKTMRVTCTLELSALCSTAKPMVVCSHAKIEASP